MDVDEVLARRRAPVAQQPRLDVLAFSGFLGADCRGDKSGPPRGSWPPASRRPSCAVPRRRADSCRRGLVAVPGRAIRVSARGFHGSFLVLW